LIDKSLNTYNILINNYTILKVMNNFFKVDVIIRSVKRVESYSILPGLIFEIVG